MAHPMHEHKAHKVEKSRVSHICKGYAHGGAVKHAEKAKEKTAHKLIGKALHADGEKSKHRMDRPHRAKGGRVKKGNAKTIVNVITGGHPASGAVPPGPPAPPLAPPMGVAPAAPPPMAAKSPMPMPPPGAGPGGPPMPMRANGGRVKRDDGGTVKSNDDASFQRMNQVSSTQRSGQQPSVSGGMRPNPNASYDPRTGKVSGFAKGGRVNQGTSVYEEGKHAGTQVQHSDGKATANKNLGRGKVVTFKSGGRVRSFYARGGKVESSDAIAPATKLPGGSGGGEARLAKAHREVRGH